MARKPVCPSPRVLVDLIQGKLVEPELSQLSGHLETCPACQEVARTLSGQDTFVESLRGEAEVPDRIAKEVPRPLVEKLKQIPRRDAGPEPATTDQTQALESATGDGELDFLAPPQRGDEIGRLGHYRVLKVLGKGGMGAVFLAEDPRLDRRVALKVMLPKVAANPTARERFLREARSAAGLKSDHVVTIYQVDEADGVPYLAMELLEGKSLADVLASQPLRAAQVVRIGRHVAAGLAAAHEKGLVHRDIKPGNLWLECPPGTSAGEPGATGGRVKILDFGLARAEQEDTALTQTGAIVGTPAYMAPEQARGDRAVDARADLFSLGCVLYRLCAGDVPFKSDTTVGTLLAIAINHPTPLSARNDAIPPALSELIMQLLEKDPARRPQSAREVLARLTQIERSLSDRDTVVVTRPSPGPVAQRVSPPNPAPAGPPRRPLPRVLVAAGLLFAALAAVVAGVVFFWQTPDAQVVRVETNDPAIKVAFGDGTLQVAGAYKEPLTLSPGPVGLKIQKGDDFEFETDKLVVSKGDRVVLRIEVLEGKVQVVRDGKGVLDSKALPVRPVPPAITKVSPVQPATPAVAAQKTPPTAIAPFDAKQARAHQRAWADYLGVPVEFITKQGMRFILIPPGEFTMGASDEDVKFLKMLTRPSNWSPTPAHKVRLTKPFYLGERELTLGEFRELLKRDPASLAQVKQEHKNPDRPVIQGCTIHDALEVCNRLSERAGLKPAYVVTAEAGSLVPRANGYRLPTEAEWEFACRAGTTTLWYYGMSAAEAAKDEKAAIRRQWERLSDPNPFGLLHLYAGTAEWCWDWDDPDYYTECARNAVTVDPQGPQAGGGRVVRGGTSWADGGLALAWINSAVRTAGAGSWVRLVLPVEGALPLLKEQITPPAAGPSVVDILTSADYEWTEPKDLGIRLLGATGHAVTADGLELWFTRTEAAGGVGKEDLWFCRRPAPDAPWGPPVNAGPSINGPGMESLPSLTADGLTLIFRHYIGAFTLQESNRADRDAPWSQRVQIAGPYIATGAVSADGLEVYAIDNGTMYRYTRPNRRAFWVKVGVVEDLPGQPLWFAPDGRWCLVAGDGKKLTTQALWLAGRAAPDRPWGAVRKVDVPVSFRGMVHPYPVLTPDGLELYFARGDKLLVARRVRKAGVLGADPDRRGAEWVLSLGGTVRVNESVLDITAVADLPAEPIRLQHVDFSGQPETDDAALARLADCRNLTGLNLRKTLVTDAGLAHLKRHKGLLSLNLRLEFCTFQGPGR